MKSVSCLAVTKGPGAPFINTVHRAVQVWECISNFIWEFTGRVASLELNMIHVDKIGRGMHNIHPVLNH